MCVVALFSFRGLVNLIVIRPSIHATWFSSAGKDVSLASSIRFLYVSYHSLLGSIVSVGVYHCVYSLEVVLLQVGLRRGLGVPRIRLRVLLETVRVIATLVREKLFCSSPVLGVIRRLPWHFHHSLKLRIDEDFSFRINVVLVICREFVSMRVILIKQRAKGVSR